VTPLGSRRRYIVSSSSTVIAGSTALSPTVIVQNLLSALDADQIDKAVEQFDEGFVLRDTSEDLRYFGTAGIRPVKAPNSYTSRWTMCHAPRREVCRFEGKFLELQEMLRGPRCTFSSFGRDEGCEARVVK
jgi:hypothetical protein